MHVKIRRATIGDAGAIAELNREVHSLHTAHAPEYFKEPSQTELVETFKAFLKNPDNTGFIALSGKSVLGYALLMRHEKPENPFCKGRREIELDQICVKRQYRKMGIGKQLIAQARKYSKSTGYNVLHLSVWEFNKNAQKAFKAVGFKEYYKKMVLKI